MRSSVFRYIAALPVMFRVYAFTQRSKTSFDYVAEANVISGLSFLNSASFEAAFDPTSDAGGNRVAHCLDVFARNRLPERGGDQIIRKRDRLLDYLTSTRIFTGKGRNKNGIRTVRVELRVNRTLIKRGHLVSSNLVFDDTGPSLAVNDAVLGHHLSNQAPFNDQLQLCRSGVRVKGV